VRHLAVVVALAGCGRIGFGAATSGTDAAASDGAGDAPGDAPPRANRAFVATTMLPGNFGGLAVADAECQMEAQQAGLPGTFIALLGDSTHTVPSRVAGSRGWIDTNGTPIVDQPTSWLDGSMFHPLRRDANGTLLDYVIAWGGDLRTCADWTVTDSATQGSVLTTSDAFGDFSVASCATSERLMCVEIGNVFPVAPLTTTGRRAFVTQTMWTPTGGIAAADAVCQSDASANGITGTFHALLSSSTGDAFARFSLAGPTWVRLDGIDDRGDGQ
jgi:hypothetical protein